MRNTPNTHGSIFRKAVCFAVILLSFGFAADAGAYHFEIFALPENSANNVDVNEGSTGATTLRVTKFPPDGASSVNVQFTGPGREHISFSGIDSNYNLSNGTIRVDFAHLDRFRDFVVRFNSPIDDDNFASDRVISARVLDPDGSMPQDTVTGKPATITIKDDEYLLLDFPDSITVDEDAGRAHIDVRHVNKHGVNIPSPITTSLRYGLYDPDGDGDLDDSDHGTATHGDDYTFQFCGANFIFTGCGTGSGGAFPLGGTAFRIDINDDNDVNSDEIETIILRVSILGNDRVRFYDPRETDSVDPDVTTKTITVNIRDNENPDLSIADANRADEGDTMAFTVTLHSPPPSGSVTVDYRTAGVTALEGSDYTAASGTLTFAQGETVKTLAVTTANDSLPEGDEHFNVILSNPAPSRVLLTDAEAAGTIALNDGGTNTALEFSVMSTADANKNEETVDIPVTLSTPPGAGRTVTVQFLTQDGTATAGTDYTAATGSLIFGGTETEKTVAVAISPDSTAGETFVFRLTGATGANIKSGSDRMTVTITDISFSEFSISPSTQTADEDDAGTVTLTVTLDPVSNAETSVRLMTSDGTATAGDDYGAVDTMITFKAGQAQHSIKVPILSDSVHGEGSETFTAALSEASGAGISQAGATATVTVTDADTTLPQIVLSGAVSADEGGDLVFEVRLVGANGQPVVSTQTVTFAWRTTGTGEDFTAASGTGTIPAGEITTTFTVATADNNDQDGQRTVSVELSSPANATFANGEMTPVMVEGTIVDNEPPVTVAAVAAANMAVLPQVAQATAMQITGAVSGRINAAFDGRRNDGVSVRGSGWKQFLASEAEKARGNERAELPDLDLNLSDFAFSIAADGDEWGGGDYGSSGGALANLGIWGRGYYGGVDVKEAGDMNNVNFDGSVVGGMIGADVLLNDKVITGLGINLSKSGIDFQTGESSGSHDTTVWSFHPYIGLKAGKSVTLYATMGYGFGSLEAMETGGGTPRENDVSLLTGGAGGKGTVYETKAGAWDVKVNALGDFVYAQLSEDGGIDGSGGIFRGGFEVAGANKGGAGASLELAYRADFGDTVGGSGMEIGGGVRFGSPSSGISVNLDGRILAFHSEDLSEYGFSGNVRWSRGKTGPYAKFSPTWGAVNDRRDDLWENGANGWSEADSSGRRYNFEAGYGVGLPEEAGIMKLFARSEMEDGETVFRSGGVDVEVGSGLTAGYETVDRSGATVEHRGYVRFGGAF